MSEFLFPEKVRVINNAVDYPITYKNAAGAEVAAASAVEADIFLFGKVKTSFLNKVTATRGLLPKKEQWTITAANASEIALAGSIPDGTKVKVEIVVKDTSRQWRNVRPEYKFGTTLYYTVVIDDADTTETFLWKLYKAINLGSYRERDFQLKATVEGSIDDAARTLDVIGLQFQERGLTIESFRVTGEDLETSTDVTAFAPVKTQEEYKGENYGYDLEFLEKLNYKNNMPYFFDDKERFDESATYTMFSFETNINRPDPKPSVYSERKRFVLYIKESSEMASYIEALADFFMTTPATRFPAMSGDGLTVTFNDAVALTNTNSASSASNLDSDHGVLTAKFGALAGTDPKLVEAQSVVLDDTLEDFILANFKTNA